MTASRNCGFVEPGKAKILIQRGTLNFSLFRQLQGVIDLDSQIANCAFKFGVTQKQLHGPEVFGSFINERCLGAAHRVSAKGCRVEPNAGHPGFYNPRILSGGYVRAGMNPAGKQKIVIFESSMFDPLE